MRKHLSKAEAVMWKNLSRRQLRGYKFRRQYSIDRYIIDFYCPELKLALEIDGDTHYRNDKREYDIEREHYIESFGVRFLRFTNNEVLHDLHGVLWSIETKIKELEIVVLAKSNIPE